jgi:hypothetical protein
MQAGSHGGGLDTNMQFELLFYMVYLNNMYKDVSSPFSLCCEYGRGKSPVMKMLLHLITVSNDFSELARNGK